jgi:hypothetical protein
MVGVDGPAKSSSWPQSLTWTVCQRNHTIHLRRTLERKKSKEGLLSYFDFVDADQLARDDPLAEASLVLHPFIPHA